MIKSFNNSEIPAANLEQSLSTEQVVIEIEKQKFSTEVSLFGKPQSSAFYPLSYGQQALWFLYEIDPKSVAYNIFKTVRISSKLDVEALRRAWKKIIERHPILRTTYTYNAGIPVQEIHEQQEVDIQIIDASNWSEDYLRAQIFIETDRPFYLETDSVLRINLFTQSVEEHILLLTMHHIAGDLWSFDILLNEFQTFYIAEIEKLDSQPENSAENLSYIEFVRWQSELLSSSKGEELWEYWQKQLAGELSILNLPTDRPRSPIQTYRGGTHVLKLDQQLIQKLRNLAIASGTNLYKILLSAFYVQLYRYTQQEDILVGIAMASRWSGEFKETVGYLVNEVVLRTSVSGKSTFTELLSQVNDKVQEAQKHQDYPFPLLVKQLQLERDSSRSPLFQVSFNSQKQRWYQPGLASSHRPRLQMEPYLLGHQRGVTSDLDVSVMEAAELVQVCWQYNTDLFDVSTIARMAGHFQTLLEEIAANPQQQISQLPLFTETERHQLLFEWNNTQVEYPHNKCIHQLFEEQVERTPDAVAVVFEGEQLTYRELNARANQLAHYLQTLGVRAEVLVGICVERSIEMIVGILGVLKAGGAYVPIDPAYPEERIAYMLYDSQLPVLLTQKKLVVSLSEYQARVIYLDADCEEISAKSEFAPITDVMPENLAYVIYTSGSTGKPKGVAMRHVSLFNLILWQLKNTTVSDQARTLQFAPVSFDVSFQEIFSTWCSGGTLVLISEEVRQETVTLLRLLAEQRVERLFLPFVALQQLAEVADGFGLFPTSLREIVTAGEQLQISPSIARLFKKLKDCKLHNQYGPSESHVVTAFTLTDSVSNWPALPPIGRPIDNTQIYILDRHLQSVPIGVPGELHIGGAGLARGYLNRPETTEAKFIPNPFSDEPGSRLYKTGDLARYLPDGNIEYLGRIDNQVKVRGFRIELGEIEAALAQHPDVREVVVICREDNPGNKHLVAYIISNLIPERIPYHSECKLELDGNTVKLHTEDISTGGVALVGVPAIGEGKYVRLHLQLPGENEPCWFSGTVVWSHPPQVGVHFHLTSSEQALVDQSVTNLLETQGWWKTIQRTLSGNLRDYLKQKLPDYMIPSAFVLMKALPLTPNGKVDRRALRASDLRREMGESCVAPRTPIEELLANIWTEVLKIDRVGIHDNFFELGGHSLKATQIMSQLREALKIELPLRSLFEKPTVAGLAATIASTIHSEATIVANTQSDLNAEAVLDPTIQPKTVPFGYTSEPKSIFLTGASGFLGAYLLYELLEQTQASVYCLLRSANEKQALQKLQSKLESYQLWKEAFSSRIIPVVGDLSKNLLGLSASLFRDLSSQIDVIYHNGAWVNLIYPYSTLKPANVLGTREVLRLASEIKLKPVHYISTIDVFSSPAYSEMKIVSESDPLEYSKDINNGYAESKWVAEKLVMLARDCGLPVCVYRPARILGHSQTGICNSDDFLSKFIPGCIQLGVAPKLDDWTENIIPVDYTSRAIVHLSRQKEFLGKAFHLVNPHPTPMNELFNCIRALGYPLEEVSYKEWRAHLIQANQVSFSEVLQSLMPIFSEENMETTNKPPEFDFTNTLSGLAGTDIVFPPIERGLIEKYFSDFTIRGLVPKRTL